MNKDLEKIKNVLLRKYDKFTDNTEIIEDKEGYYCIIEGAKYRIVKTIGVEKVVPEIYNENPHRSSEKLDYSHREPSYMLFDISDSLNSDMEENDVVSLQDRSFNSEVSEYDIEEKEEDSTLIELIKNINDKGTSNTLKRQLNNELEKLDAESLDVVFQHFYTENHDLSEGGHELMTKINGELYGYLFKSLLDKYYFEIMDEIPNTSDNGVLDYIRCLITRDKINFTTIASIIRGHLLSDNYDNKGNDIQDILLNIYSKLCSCYTDNEVVNSKYNNVILEVLYVLQYDDVKFRTMLIRLNDTFILMLQSLSEKIKSKSSSENKENETPNSHKPQVESSKLKNGDTGTQDRGADETSDTTTRTKTQKSVKDLIKFWGNKP